MINVRWLLCNQSISLFPVAELVVKDNWIASGWTAHFALGKIDFGGRPSKISARSNHFVNIEYSLRSAGTFDLAMGLEEKNLIFKKIWFRKSLFRSKQGYWQQGATCGLRAKQ